jgi:glycosyltransferase involved in cell wall biosynthesis
MVFDSIIFCEIKRVLQQSQIKAADHFRQLVWEKRRHRLSGYDLDTAKGIGLKPAVLFVHSNSELYGADFILLQVVLAVKDQVEPIVALPGEGVLTDRLRSEGVRVVITRESVLRRINFKPHKLPRFYWNLLRDTAALVRIIRKENVRLVYSNTAAVLTGALAAKKCRIPNLYHIHEIITDPPWMAKAIARMVLKYSRGVIAVSRAVREQLLRYERSGDPPVEVIHNGIDTSGFDPGGDIAELRRELGAGPENVLFGVIGRIHPWKGQSYFVESARLVADICPRARFVIVGGTFPGYEHLVAELHEQIRRLGLRDRCRVLPHRTDIPQVMRALDVFVLPSTSPDPLPTVVLEAMAAERPVVATAHGGALEMVLHGDTGLLAPYQDVGGFSEALLELADDAAMRRRMGAEGRARLLQYFSKERFNDDIRNYLSRFLASPETESQAIETKLTEISR